MAKRSSVQAVLATVASCAAIGALASACSASGQPSHSTATSSAGSGGAGSGGAISGGSDTGGSNLFGDAGDGPPPLDAGGLCGNQIHQVLTDAPNLYFVFDISGSMAAFAQGGFTRYQLVEHAAVQMIETLGPLINVGAAAFPLGATEANACAIGGEVFPVSPGDPVAPTAGPTTYGFIAATTLNPAGGTPTAATLTALQPGLVALKGRTIVLLATDGGPNCDAAISCASDACIPNIEGSCVPLGSNCCAAGGTVGPTGCLDADASVAAVAALKAAAIPVVVIGIPGSELYATVLDDMAVAGGAPQQGTTSYYDVSDYDVLEQTFQSIASAYISCTFTLTDPPPDEQHTNVYFDQSVVPQDPVNGWVWVSPSVIELVGAACTELKNGMVQQVQIVSGCPTQVPP
jgi:hypothetical protein